MAMFKFKPFHTSKVWQFPDPDTGYLHRGRDRAELVKSIVSYRANNELAPIDYLDSVLENYLCGLDVNCGECETMQLRRGFLAYIKGGISLLKFYFFPESSRVDQATADRRAEQCVRCKHNVFPTNEEELSGFMAWTDSVWQQAVAPAKSAFHDQLGHCDICSCVLKSLVFYKGPHGLSGKELSQAREVKCWKLEKPAT